jgi:hypothetical protein
MTQTYYFPVSDFPNGGFDSQSLADEIRAVGSGVTVQLAGDPSSTLLAGVPNCAISFKESVNDHAALAAVVAAHQNNPAPQVDRFEAVVHVGGKPTMIDGLVLSGTAGVIREDFAIVTDLHIQGSLVHWKNMKAGDRAYSVLVLPEAKAPSLVQANPGVEQLSIPPSAAPYWLGSSGKGPKMIELWDATYSTVSELIFVSGVSQADASSPLLIDLEKPVEKTHPADALVLPVFATFHQIRGDLEGGVYMVGDGHLSIENQTGVTALIPAGLSIGVRLLLSDSNSEERCLVANYRFRLPEKTL